MNTTIVVAVTDIFFYTKVSDYSVLDFSRVRRPIFPLDPAAAA